VRLFEICSRLHAGGVVASRQAMSQHLDVLGRAGLVQTRRAGRTTLHRLDTAPLAEVVLRWPMTGIDREEPT
jgi:DNA-binding transcriptional ArsR family regulator